MRMRPARVSAMKISWFGATRSSRGADRPEAKSFTVKPCGTDGTAPAGGATTSGPLPADTVLKGAGSAARSTECFSPGASFIQSPGSGAWGPA